MSDKEDGQDRIEDTESKAVTAASKMKPEYKYAIIAAVVACVVGVAIGCGVAFGVAGSNSQNAQIQPAWEQQSVADDSGNGDASGNEAAQEVHKHDWVAEYETVHHDAETHVVHHPATYENQTVYSTQCNVCGEYLDSSDNEGTGHCAATGHKGFTKEVPHKETVQVKAAWDETVTDKAAYDESVLKDYKCSTCGVSADPETVQNENVNQPTEA